MKPFFNSHSRSHSECKSLSFPLRIHSITKHFWYPRQIPQQILFKERESLEMKEIYLKKEYKKSFWRLWWGNQLCRALTMTIICRNENIHIVSRELNASLSKFNCRVMNYLIKCLVSELSPCEKNFKRSFFIYDSWPK